MGCDNTRNIATKKAVDDYESQFHLFEDKPKLVLNNLKGTIKKQICVRKGLPNSLISRYLSDEEYPKHCNYEAHELKTNKRVMCLDNANFIKNALLEEILFIDENLTLVLKSRADKTWPKFYQDDVLLILYKRPIVLYKSKGTVGVGTQEAEDLKKVKK